MTGESIWFLLALPLDPSLGDRLTAPWGHVSSAVMPVVLMSLVQGAALSLLILPLLLRSLALRRTLVLAALAPALFLVLNRVFSPQYLLPISVSALAALTLVQPGRQAVLAALAALALAQAANLLVWPFFQERWILANTLLFAVLLPLLIWLAFQAVRLPEEPLATREQRWDVVSEVSEHGQAAS
ncbi:MAG: hypothetical protein KatS3mg057_0163 [Herpetosiphonaceae bacterium]|nr:MAG: hypothetical protein KatS3mg057_0163 [Herpetosiphonaceae bacterium]